MAKSRNEVLSLFGATPQQIMEKERREQAMMVLSQQDPFQRAGSAIGVGLARLFGGKSANVLEAEKLQQTKQGLNLTTVEGMTEAAKRLQAAGFQDRALELLDMADRKTTAEQTRDLAGRQIVNKTVTRTVNITDQFGDTKQTAVRIPIPHMYDMKTRILTPIFTEVEIQAEAEAAAQVPPSETDGTSKAETRVITNMRRDLIDLKPGETYELPSGRFVRKLPNGQLSRPMTRDEINKESGIDEQASPETLGGA